MLISLESKKQAAGSKCIHSYSIRKMTHFTPCGVKRVSGPFSSTVVRKKIFVIIYIYIFHPNHIKNNGKDKQQLTSQMHQGLLLTEAVSSSDVVFSQLGYFQKSLRNIRRHFLFKDITVFAFNGYLVSNSFTLDRVDLCVQIQ